MSFYKIIHTGLPSSFQYSYSLETFEFFDRESSFSISIFSEIDEIFKIYVLNRRYETIGKINISGKKFRDILIKEIINTTNFKEILDKVYGKTTEVEKSFKIANLMDDITFLNNDFSKYNCGLYDTSENDYKKKVIYHVNSLLFIDLVKKISPNTMLKNEFEEKFPDDKYYINNPILLMNNLILTPEQEFKLISLVDKIKLYVNVDNIDLDNRSYCSYFKVDYRNKNIFLTIFFSYDCIGRFLYENEFAFEYPFHVHFQVNIIYNYKERTIIYEQYNIIPFISFLQGIYYKIRALSSFSMLNKNEMNILFTMKNDNLQDYMISKFDVINPYYLYSFMKFKYDGNYSKYSKFYYGYNDTMFIKLSLQSGDKKEFFIIDEYHDYSNDVFLFKDDFGQFRGDLWSITFDPNKIEYIGGLLNAKKQDYFMKTFRQFATPILVRTYLKSGLNNTFAIFGLYDGYNRTYIEHDGSNSWFYCYNGGGNIGRLYQVDVSIHNFNTYEMIMKKDNAIHYRLYDENMSIVSELYKENDGNLPRFPVVLYIIYNYYHNNDIDTYYDFIYVIDYVNMENIDINFEKIDDKLYKLTIENNSDFNIDNQTIKIDNVYFSDIFNVSLVESTETISIKFEGSDKIELILNDNLLKYFKKISIDDLLKNVKFPVLTSKYNAVAPLPIGTEHKLDFSMPLAMVFE